MKNILMVIGSSLVNAGVPGVVMKIVRSLHTVCSFDVIVGSSAPGYYDDEFLSYGGEIYRYDKVTYEDGKFRLLSGGKQTYEFVKSVLQKKPYDVVHTHEGYLSGAVLKTAKEMEVPIRIVHSHGTYYVRGKNLPVCIFKLNLMGKIGRYATKCVACSNISGQTLFRGWDFENILNPIDAKAYLDLDKQAHAEINLIQIGYYCKLKNQLFSIEVLRALLQQGKNAHIHFIGYDNGSGYQKKLEQRIRECGLEQQVHFYAADADKTKILPYMDFLLLPSSSEGMPLTALEAQASHTYCIASTQVPEDCDMGLFTRLDVDAADSASKWADWIIHNRAHADTLDVNKIMRLDTEFWVNRIGVLYGLWTEEIREN